MILDQIVVSNLKNVRKNYAGLHEITRTKNNKCNNYSGLPVEMQLLKAIKKERIASNFSTSHASSKVR